MRTQPYNSTAPVDKPVGRELSRAAVEAFGRGRTANGP